MTRDIAEITTSCNRYEREAINSEVSVLRTHLAEAVGLLRDAGTLLTLYVPDHIQTNPDHRFGKFEDRRDAFLARIDGKAGA